MKKKLNGYVNLKRTVGYQSTKIGKFACYILACLSSCLITEWLPDLHSGTKEYIGRTVSCFAGSVFTSMVLHHQFLQLSCTKLELRIKLSPCVGNKVQVRNVNVEPHIFIDSIRLYPHNLHSYGSRNWVREGQET